MHNELDTAIRFDPARDHHIRHNPGEAPVEYNAPETFEIPDKEFVAIAMEAGLVKKEGKTYMAADGKTKVGTKQVDVVNYVQDNEVLMAKWHEYYEANQE